MTINRRTLIVAGAAALGLALPPTVVEPKAFRRWRGFALGADAEILFAGLSESRANLLASKAMAEIRRLESCFSLFEPGSELCRLNRDGQLSAPSLDFRLLLHHSLQAWSDTGGAFNPAIQPLWRTLAHHFGHSDKAPPTALVEEVLRFASPEDISMSPAAVKMRPGMALTFNGIAQGYITDRIAGLLRDQGLCDVLIATGEWRALPGRAWDVGLADGSGRLMLSDRALAQSSGAATSFTADGRWHHLLDPVTGESARRLASITVTAPTAAVADMLSTALYVAPPRDHARILRLYPGAEIATEQPRA